MFIYVYMNVSLCWRALIGQNKLFKSLLTYAWSLLLLFRSCSCPAGWSMQALFAKRGCFILPEFLWAALCTEWSRVYIKQELPGWQPGAPMGIKGKMVWLGWYSHAGLKTFWSAYLDGDNVKSCSPFKLLEKLQSFILQSHGKAKYFL